MRESENSKVKVYIGLDREPLIFSKQYLITCGVTEAIGNNLCELNLIDIIPHRDIDVVNTLIHPHLHKINLNESLNNFLWNLPHSLDFETWKTKYYNYWQGYNENLSRIELSKRLWVDMDIKGTNHSELWFNQPIYDYYQTIIKSILENTKISPQEFEREINQLRDHANEDLSCPDNWYRKAENLIRKLWPAYVSLRKIRYTDYDLTS